MNARHKHIFCFAHATDLHYDSRVPAQERDANSRIKCLIRDINGIEQSERPEFILLSGDLTNSGSANYGELLAARTLCDSFNIPYHTIAGNHDLAPNRKFAAMYPGKEDYHDGTVEESNYARVFPLKFLFERRGYWFVGLSLRDEDPDGMLGWLEDTIRAIPGKGIVVTHYGMYPPRAAGPLHTWGFSRIHTILPRLRAIVANAGDKIVACLYGHNHINSVVKRDGIYHISGGGIQKGCTGYRLFKCYQDRIESSFHVLSEKSLLDFNYWGVKNPGQCRDIDHHTVEEYHRGNRDEQFFVVPLDAQGDVSHESSTPCADHS